MPDGQAHAAGARLGGRFVQAAAAAVVSEGNLACRAPEADRRAVVWVRADVAHAGRALRRAVIRAWPVFEVHERGGDHELNRGIVGT